MAVIDEQSRFRGLEDWTLKNVQTNRRQIGNGAYSSVEEVEMDGVVCVAKRIHPILVYSNDSIKRTRERFVQECIIMSKLRHPHIVQFLGVFFPSPEDQRRESSFSISSFSGSYSHSQLGGGGPQSPPPINPTGLPWLIMEYLPYTLDHVLEKCPNIPIHVKISLLLDISKGLLYLHNKEIYHCNLTARNILITSFIGAKIADFGVARMFKTTVSNMASVLTTLPGNQLYMPPEADQERSGGTTLYESTIDIFSFGVIILFMITQMFPCNLLSLTYPDPDRPGAVRGRTEVERRERYFEIAEASSKMDENQQLIKLSQHCLQNNPSNRPKAEVVLEELIYFEKHLANKRPNGSTEIWKKDKLQLMELLDEKQKSAHSQPDPEVKEKTDSESVQLSKPKADQSKKLFKEAMQSGYVVLRTIVLLLIGVAGAGKTCFCHMLFDEPPPALRETTPLAKSSIRANSSLRGRGKDLSFKRAALSHREGAVFWERISAEMFNSLIAENIKSFEPGTNPGVIAEHLSVLLSVSEDLQHRVVPPIEHTVSAHEMYRETDRAETTIVSSRAETVTVSQPQLSDIDQLFEMESVKQLLGMISQSKGSVELLRREWLYIVDSGGQPQFHELLPTFIRHVSAVAFFVKLNETLATRPMIEYYSKGGCLCEPYQSSQTNLQIIQNCLQAMQARCLVEDTVKCPELFFIGTHYDDETQEERLSDKNAQLSAILHQHTTFRKHLAYNSLGNVDELLYPVNAQTPSATDKQVVAGFRQDIIEKCQRHERKIPIRWFVLESLLQELSQHGIISFKKCQEVAGRLGMDENRLRAAIKYLAQLNIFEFYPSVLPDVVFTTSQVLLTKVTELVEYSHLLRNNSVAHCSSDDKEFRDNGYLNVKFLEHKRFSSHFVSGLFEVKNLLALLEDRLVITKQGPGKFMMMAVLSDLLSEKLEEHRLAISKSSTHVPIAVHYPGSLFPAGIFTSLVSHLQTSSNWTILMNDQTGKPECLFKNCVDFMIDTDKLNAFITLIYTHQWIELHVQIDGDQQQACSLKRMLFDGLKHAAEVQKYSNITPELAFLCPHEQKVLNQAGEESQPPSPPPPHLATVTRNKQRIRCKLDKRISYEVKEKYSIWITSSKLTESNATADYENRSVLLRHLSVIRWKDDSGLNQRFHLMDRIAHEWRTLGEVLDVPFSKLKSIADEYRGKPKECCRAILGQWLDNPPRNYPITWHGLLELLEDSQLGQVVAELRAILDKASL